MTHFHTPVHHYMSSPVHSLDASASLEEADRAIRAHRISALAITTEGSLQGVLSRTDLLRQAEVQSGETFSLPEGVVGGIMTKPALTVDAEAPIAEAAELMHQRRIHRVFVLREGDLVGVLSTGDLMHAVAEAKIETPLSEVATKPVITIRTEDHVAVAVERLERSNKQGLVVVHDRWPVGSFRQSDALVSRAKAPTTPVEEVMDLRILTLPGTMPLYRAACQALAMDVRRILLVGDGVEGIVSGLDFARAVK